MSSVYQIVTEKIIRMLEAGKIPWKQPWMAVRPAHSKITGKPYSLINQILLCDTGPGAYATYDQWIRLGGCVRRGAKAGTIVFWSLIDKVADDGEVTKRPCLRYYRVFHESQIEGIEPEINTEVNSSVEPLSAAEDLLNGYIKREKIVLEEMSTNRAYYDPKGDLIHIPSKKQFALSEQYYGVYAHEIVHSTGHSSRLNRRGVQNISFGSEMYGFEELVAEIGSAYLLASIGISTTETLTYNVAYIQNWMNAIKNDDHMIVKAASAAERAVDYIKGVDG